MANRTIMLAVAAAAAMAFTGVSSARAGTLLKDGDTVAGWQIFFPAGISLVDDGGATLTIQKTADFFSFEGLPITFSQVSYSASSTITIAGETINNKTSSGFGGFDFLLENPAPGDGGLATFAPGPAFNNSTSPFKTQVQNADNTQITLSDGVLPAGGTTSWGSDAGPGNGELVINTKPATSGLTQVIRLKEIPTPSIPLPSAAWAGLVGLVGLGAFGGLKRMRGLA